MIVLINGSNFTLPVLGLVASAITGVAGWWLGLSITRHPLQAHLRAGARVILLALPRGPFPPAWKWCVRQDHRVKDRSGCRLPKM
jgi:hypothetical protein